MKIEQLYTKCLAQGAYYIESEGEVAIIDPLRETKSYIQLAEDDNAKIKYVFETHFHADFVSGHVTLAEKTGAEIVFGPTAKTNYSAHVAFDGEEFKVGKLTIKVLHTPGHTMESTTYLLIDKKGINQAIFSGDTLFLGDVGRPDLAQKASNLSKEELAGLLYDSLRNKIMPLEDHVVVYPGHGAGSACGKKMMDETRDTLGNQKRVNYALRSDLSKEAFIEEVTDGLLPPPSYFPFNVQLNKKGYPSIDDLIEKGLQSINVNDFEQAIKNKEILLLDVRTPIDFAKGHVPNSLFIGLDGTFAPWVGEIVSDLNQPILLIVPVGREEETIIRLARVGYDNVIGYLDGGFSAWENANKPIEKVQSIPANSLVEEYDDKNLAIIDVRKESEFLSQHLVAAKNIPLNKIKTQLDHFPKAEFYIHCAGGYRSMIATSILKINGIHHIIDIKSGFNAIKETDMKLSNTICSSNL